MSALKEKRSIAEGINLVYDFTDKPNNTNLSAKEDRAVISKIRADLVLPEEKILTVDIDFDTDSGYHDNAIMIMDDFGVEMLATSFEVKYGKVHAEKIRTAWNEKQNPNAPRKPTYLLVQKPKSEDQIPAVFAICGDRKHPPRKPINQII